jgi:hypothetical protein
MVQIAPLELIVIGVLLLVGLSLIASGKRRGGYVAFTVVAGLVLLPLFFRLITRGPALHAAVAQTGATFVRAPAFLLILILLLVGGVIFALIKGGKGTKIGIGVGAVLVFLFIALFTFPVQREAVYTETVSAVAVVQQAPGMDSLPPVWSDGMEKEFQADVYPSAITAAKALGRQIVDMVPTVVPDKQMPTTIQICGQINSTLHTEVLYAIQEGMQFQGNDVKILVETVFPSHKIERTDSRAATVEVTQTIHQTQTIHYQVQERRHGPDNILIQPKDIVIIHGGIGVSISGQAGQIVRSAEFVEKPWIENFSRFTSGFPNDGFLLARSQESCTDSNQAQQQALQNACLQLASMVWSKRTQNRGSQVLSGSTAINPHDLQRHGLILDKFTQSFQGSQGRIWREALLLDVAPEKIARLRQKVLHVSSIERQGWAKMIFSLVAMLGLICGLYVFLNYATKGYYATSLRVGTVVLVVIGAILVLLFAA